MRVVDWYAKAEYAKGLSIAMLYHAIKDCITTAQNFKGTELEGYYHDEASVYRTELARKQKASK